MPGMRLMRSELPQRHRGAEIYKESRKTGKTGCIFIRFLTKITSVVYQNAVHGIPVFLHSLFSRLPLCLCGKNNYRAKTFRITSSIGTSWISMSLTGSSSSSALQAGMTRSRFTFKVNLPGVCSTNSPYLATDSAE